MLHEAALRDAWMAAMRRGDFTAAHAISDTIRLTIAPPPPATTPRHLQRVWSGQPVDGKHVLVRCHHGLGDTIQFARFLPELARRTRALTVYAQQALLPLLQTLPLDTAEVSWHAIDDGEPSVTRDLDIEIMELLQLFRCSIATLPREVPYLHIPPAPRRRQETSVGIVWSAGGWAMHRSMHVADIMPLLDIPGIAWCSLQHAPTARSRSEAQRVESHPVLQVRAERPVWCTAREMRALDLVISVDSMPAHLAGALGVPVWTVLPYDADWRWMSDRRDSPWYPTMRLFRQHAPGDWVSVVNEVRGALEGWHRNRGE